MLAADAVIHPALSMKRVWPSPDGYPWKDSGQRLFTREGLLCRTAPGQLLMTWTTGAFCEPTPGNFTMFARSTDNGETWGEPAVIFRHTSLGLFTTELFLAGEGEVHAFLQTYPMMVPTKQTASLSSRASRRSASDLVCTSGTPTTVLAFITWCTK